MAKKNKVAALGFDDNNQLNDLSPLGPIEDTTYSLGFNNPAPTTAAAVEGPTPSKQYTEGYLVGTSLKDHLAANQDGWDQFANFLEQSAVGALTGTVESAAYMLDLKQHKDWLYGQEQEYSNWISDKMKEWKEANKEAFPVYLSEENETFQPGNAEWWAHHGGETVGTVLGLLIPAAAAAKAGKLAGLGKIGQTLSATVASRSAESTMEANQVFEQTYSKLKEQGKGDEEAKLLAGEAATRTWNTNWLFAIQDFGQFGILAKGARSAAKGSLGKTIGNLLTQVGTESAEEAGQYTVSEEAQRAALDTNIDFFGEGFMSRLDDYVDDDEFKTAVTLGGAGGGVFAGAGSIMKSISDPDPNAPIQRAKDKVKKLVDWGLGKERANYVGDTGTSVKYDNLVEANQIVDRFNKGKLPDYISELEEYKKMPDLDNDARATIDAIIKDTEEIIDMDAKLKASSTPAAAHKPLLLNRLEQMQNTRLIDKTKNELQKIKDEAYKEIPPPMQQAKDLEINLMGYKELARTQPQYAYKAAQLQAEWNRVSKELGPAAGALMTAKDDDLYLKAFQLASSTEKAELLKAEMQELKTPQGIAKQQAANQRKTEVEQAKAAVANPNATNSDLEKVLATLKNEEAQNIVMEGIRDRVSKKQEGNMADTVDRMGVPTMPSDMLPPDIVGPEDEGYDPGVPEGPEVAPPDEMFPPDVDPNYIDPNEIEIDSPQEPEYTPEIEVPEITAPEIEAPGQANEPDLSLQDANALIDRVDVEQPPNKTLTNEERDKALKAMLQARTRTTVPAWLQEHNPKTGEVTLYTNNRTGEKVPATEVFAVDEETGQLLANTPKVAIGDTVILKVENEFKYTYTPGFKPTGPENYVINVYKEGVDKPIKQLPSEDHPRYKGNNEPIKALRQRVIAAGELRTTIVAKNIGSIRKLPVPQTNEISVLEYDYFQEGDWKYGQLPHNPVLGYLDFNGRVKAPNARGMRGMTSEVADEIEIADTHLFTKDLRPLKGKLLTFRTSPDGTKRIVGLEPRKLDSVETAWLLEHLPTLIANKDFSTIENVIYIPQHSAGIYSTKGGKKPDLLKQSRRRIHVIKTSAKTSDIAIPMQGTSGAGLWILMSNSQLAPMIAGQPFSFKVMNAEGEKGPVQYDSPKQAGIATTFRKLLGEQYKNFSAANLNVEISYTDPVTGVDYPNYYEYVKATETATTNLKGSVTMGKGEDSSYTFDEAEIYLDPNPSEVKITIEDRTVKTIEQPPVPQPITPAEPAKPSTVEAIKAAAKKRRSKLSPAVHEGYDFKVITEKELQWFKDHIGAEFLTVVKGVDTFIANNGVTSYGTYNSALATVAEYAKEGTAYHEAGHFLLDPLTGLITSKEKYKLIQQAAKHYKVDLNQNPKAKEIKAINEEIQVIHKSAGDTITRGEAMQMIGTLQAKRDAIEYMSDPIYEVEELIMKDFERYKLSDGRYKPQVAEAKGFFKRLLVMIKNLLGFKNPIEKLLYTLDNTVISTQRRQQLKKYRNLDQSIIRNKKLEGFQTVADQQEAISAFSSEIIRLANEAARDKGVTLSKIVTDQTTLDNIIKAVKENFTERYRALAAIQPSLDPDDARHDVFFNFLGMGLVSKEEVPDYKEYVGEFEDPKNEAGFSVDGFKTKVIKDLSRYGFRVGINYDQEEALELKQEDEGERLYDIDHTLINPSESITQRVRLFLASIPEPVTDEENRPTGETKTTMFGTPKFIDFKRVDANITLKLRDAVDPIQRLQELAENDAYAKVIFDRLMDEKNKGNIQLFNEFAAKYKRDGYYKKTIRFDTKRTPIDPEDIDPTNPTATTKVEHFAKTIDSDRGSSDRTLFNQWREAAINKKITDSDGTVNLVRAKPIARKMQELNNDRIIAQNNAARIPYKELQDKFNSILKDLGVTVPSQVWEQLANHPKPGVAYSRLEKMVFGMKTRSLEDLVSRMLKDGADPYEGSNVISDMARLSSVYMDDPRGASFMNEANNPEFPINFPSALTEFVNRAKENAQEVFKYYDRDPFYKDNAFLQAIKSNVSTVNLSFSSFTRNQDRLKDFTRRTEIDSLITRFATFFNNAHDATEGWFYIGTFSDKTKQGLMSLPVRRAQQARNFLSDVLKTTMNAEIARMNRLRVTEETGVKQHPLPIEVDNLRRGEQFLYIPILNSVPNLKASLSKGEINSKEYKEAMKAAETAINTFINAQYDEFKRYLEKHTLINIDPNGTVTPNENRFPKGLLKGHTTEAFLKEFFYNDTAWRLSMSQVLMGDIAQYKSSDDYFKRAYQLVTPGIKGRSEGPESITRAIYPKQTKLNTPEVLNRLAKMSSKETGQKYEKVNKTDAQSLITIHGYRKLANSLGQWSNDMEELYKMAWANNMTVRQALKIGRSIPEGSPGHVSEARADELQKLANKIVLQPFKPFQYNDREITMPDGSIMIIKEQFKDSITPITPELANAHSGYSDLLGYMIDNKVDIMSAADTAKVGSYGVVDFSQPIQPWQTRRVKLSDFRFPQLMPEKRKEEILGSQLHKLILGNLDMKATYKVGNRTLSGEKLLEEYNTVWSEKIQASSQELQTRLGVDASFTLSEDKVERRAQLYKLKVVLQEEIASRDLNENYLDILDIIKLGNEEFDFTLPLSFPAFGTKIQSILTNLWKKAVLRQKSTGYSSINLADFGVGYSDELQFMAEDKDGVYTEIGLPIDFTGDIGLKWGEHILPTGRIMWDKLNDNQKSALELIVYRIPTSNKSSMLPVRVAMIVPSQLNNVVIIPGELTIQQGLDFDVDKSSLLRRPLDTEGAIDKDAVDTKLFDLYWGILTDPKHTPEMLTPLATPTLEAILEEYKSKNLVNMGTDSIFYTTQSDIETEIRNKDGRTEIGIASIFNTGHAVLQTIKPYIGINNRSIRITSGKQGYEYNELGRKEDASGKLISENYGETQQAALDAAKNPLLAYFNIVRGTMSTFQTMLAFGVPLKVATDFFMQPVIKEWTKFYKQENEHIGKATAKLLEAYPQIEASFNAVTKDGEVRMITPTELAGRLELPVGHNPTLDGIVLGEFMSINVLSGQLSNINNVLSIDTFQNATSIEAMQAMRDLADAITDNRRGIYIDKSLFNIKSAPPAAKRLASYFHYGIDNALAFTGDIFPSASDSYQAVVDHYSAVTGDERVNEDVIKDLHKFTDFFNLEGDSLLSRTLTKIHPSKSSYTNRWNYFNKDFSIWTHITDLIGRYPDLAKNELIKNIESTRTTADSVVMIGVRNTDSNINKTEITNGWYEMLNANTPEIRSLAHDLVRYSIFTSGFNYGPRSMFDLIPVSFWSESGLAGTWKDLHRTVEMITLDKEAIVVNFIRHRYKDMERFPEQYGTWGKKGFKSKLIRNVKADGRHILSFNLDMNVIESAPRFLRLADTEIDDYRLYEQDRKSLGYFKEVQPLGEKQAYTEISADGRHQSSHPYNQQFTLDTDPWKDGDKITLASPLYSDATTEGNAYLAKYLPLEKNDPKVVIERLLVDEVELETKKTLEHILKNIDKVNVPIEIGVLKDMAGKLSISKQGDIKIVMNKEAGWPNETEVRHVLTHELIHAYSTGILYNPITPEEQSFVRNIERTIADLKPKFKNQPYGLTNRYEFIAELASNNEFRAQLRSKEGIWTRILRYFRKLFDFKDTYDKYLDQLYTIMDKADYTGRLLADKEFSFVSKEERKQMITGTKRISIFDEMVSSLEARLRKLKAQGVIKKGEAAKLDVAINNITKLLGTNRNLAVVAYVQQVNKEVGQMQAAYDLMAKEPDRINPEVLYSMREQILSYKPMETFSAAIHKNPQNFITPGVTPKELVEQVDDLKNKIWVLSNKTRKLAIRRFATLVMQTLNDPSLTLENVVDQLDIADRDIDFQTHWGQTGMETNDVAVKTAAKLIKDNASKAYLKIQDDQYVTKPEQVEGRLAYKEANDTGDGFHWETRGFKFTKHGMMETLRDYEKWLGKGASSIADKFKPVIETTSLHDNDDGVHLISPFSKKGQDIMSIPEGSPNYPLRKFYETFVLGYLKSQESIAAFSMRPGLRIPSIQRSMLEGILKEEGMGKFVVFKEGFFDLFRKRYDETDFQAVDETGRPQEFIPVRFIAKQDGKDGRLSTKEVSLDIATTLPIFIHEMYSRKGLTELVADLELGKLVLEEREVMKTKAIKGTGLVPWLSSDTEGITLESGKFETIKGVESKSFESYSSLLRRFVYGQMKKSEGDFEANGKRFSVAKIVDSFLRFTGFKIMFGNVAIPMTNSLVGEYNMVKEVVGGNIITLKDYWAGKKLFMKAARAAIADLGQREKKTKYGRIYSYFNLGDNTRPVGDLGISTNYTRTVFDKITRTGASLVDYYLNSTALGAVMNRFSAKDKEGKDISLYDAIEISKEGKVVLQDGYTYKGKKSLTPEDIIEVREYGLRVSQLMNGVYNKMDKSAMNEFVAGRLLGFMRNWLKPGLDARWRTKFYDERLKQANEGHYISALVGFNNFFAEGGFLRGSVDSIRMMLWMGARDEKLLLLPNELQLSEDEQKNIINLRKSNIRKTLFELYVIAAVALTMALAWDDDDEDSYVKYMLARVRRELTTFISPTTAWDVLRSPTVALNTVETMSKIIYDVQNSGSAIIMGEEQPIYERGPGKGQNKLYYDTGKLFGLGFTTQFEDLDTKTRLIVRGYR